jgi:hypothetical protein
MAARVRSFDKTQSIDLTLNSLKPLLFFIIVCVVYLISRSTGEPCKCVFSASSSVSLKYRIVVLALA